MEIFHYSRVEMLSEGGWEKIIEYITRSLTKRSIKD